MTVAYISKAYVAHPQTSFGKFSLIKGTLYCRIYQVTQAMLSKIGAA